jgi:hypothetical protein
MIAPVHQSPVTQILVVMNPLFLVMTMMLVLMTNVINTRDVPTLLLIVMITISVLMIHVTHHVDVNMKYTNVSTKMLATL